MNIFNIDNFPFVKFGDKPSRKVKLIMSPETTNEERFSIVYVEVPSGGISEGHIHEESDELIYFEGNGKIILDEEEFKVKKNSIVFVPRGKMHECINTGEKNLNLLCIFIPPFKPYGKYPKLIKKTKQEISRDSK